MKKLILFALVLMMTVLASGCYDDVVYKECYPKDTTLCLWAGENRGYVDLNGFVVPTVTDERYFGTWGFEDSMSPVLSIHRDGNIEHLASDGEDAWYVDGKWAWFGPFGMFTVYENDWTSIWQFTEFTEDGNSAIFREIQNGQVVSSGVLYRVKIDYKGQSL